METRTRGAAGPAPHPAVRALWCAACLTAAMGTFEPVVLALSLALAVASSLVCRGASATAGSLAAALPLMALVAVVNPLVSPVGGTTLLSVGPFEVRLEAVAWGLAMGAMVAAAMLWAQVCAAVLPADDLRDLLGGALPTLGLALSMVVHLVPELLSRARASKDAQDACTCSGDGGAASALSRAVGRTGAMVGWALGESVERASSMASRGWGVGRRTHWRARRWTAGDRHALVAVAAVSAAGVGCALWLGSLWTYSPSMGAPGPWPAYLPVALLFALPCLAAAADALAACGEA